MAARAARAVGIMDDRLPSDPPIHPIAAVFPMLPDDELDALAAHIKAHGLQNPIKIGPDGSIWDGRNRRAACKRAGVEPTYETLPMGTDPLAYILGANDHRRHNSTGQRAMAVALAIREHERLNNIVQSVSGAARDAGLERQRVSQALVVIDHAPDLAELVRSGDKYLHDAYAEARQRGAGADRSSQAAPLGTTDSAARIADQALGTRRSSRRRRARVSAASTSSSVCGQPVSPAA